MRPSRWSATSSPRPPRSGEEILRRVSAFAGSRSRPSIPRSRRRAARAASSSSAPGELGTVIIAHKVPNGRDADQPALEMLDAILSSGKNARLYRALVDQGLALNAGAGTDLHRDLSLHTLYAAAGARARRMPKWSRRCSRRSTRSRADGVTRRRGRARQAAISRRRRLQAGWHRGGRERAQRVDRGRRLDFVRDAFRRRSSRSRRRTCSASRKQYLNEDQSTTGWFVPTPQAAEKGS